MKRVFTIKLSWLFVAALTFTAYPAFSQQTGHTLEPLVILTALTSPPGDTVAGTLASTMTSSVELMLKLTGSVNLKRADFLIPTSSLQRTIPYYENHKADEAVYGSVTPTGNGGYKIDFDVWSAANSNGKSTVVKRTITNVLSSFSLADAMSLKVASTIVGRKLEEGTLVVQNTSSLPKFSVYANGHLLGRNRTSYHILTGSWKIVVAKPGVVGDVPLQTFRVRIQRNTTTIVSVSEFSSPSTASKSSASASKASRPRAIGHAGNVMVVSREGGSIFVDNTRAATVESGKATLLPPLSYGKHVVEIVYDNGTTRSKAIDITNDIPLTLHFAGPTFSPPPIRLIGKAYSFESGKYGVPGSPLQLLVKRLEEVPNVPANLQSRINTVNNDINFEAKNTAVDGWVFLVGGVTGVSGFIWALVASSNGSSTTGGAVLGGVGGLLTLSALTAQLIVFAVGGSRLKRDMNELRVQWNRNAKSH